jgi:Ca2+-binding EF-hand superfamily protein
MGSRIEQVKDELKKIFDMVDADHNGQIDKQEAKALIDKVDAHVLERFGEEIDTPQNLVNKLFRKLDIDGDGGVDFDEVCPPAAPPAGGLRHVLFGYVGGDRSPWREHSRPKP